MLALAVAWVQLSLMGWRWSGLLVGLLVGLAVGAAQSSRVPRNVEPPFPNVQLLTDVNGSAVFELGSESYPTLTLHGGKLFVGAKNRLVSLNATNLEMIAEVSVPSDPGPPTCRDCDNYISVLRPLNNERLLVCGTNNQQPYCRQRSSQNLSELTPRHFFSRDQLLAPVVPLQNVSWLVADATAGDYRVCIGTHQEISSSGALGEPTFARVALEAGTTAMSLSLRLKTTVLRDPQFVGDPIEYNGRIYFFFREIAEERAVFGGDIYSRVGVVCKNDTGGKAHATYSKEQMVTFAKARLDCSTLGEFPFQYNLIRDVYQSTVTEEVVFAVFAASVHVRASAVCAYRLDEIEQLFTSGSPFSAAADGSNYQPQTPDPVTPRPASCPDTSSYSESEYQLIENEAQLMYNSAENRLRYETRSGVPKDSALLQLQGESPTRIVMDEDVKDDTDVMFIGTEKGAVIKAYLREYRSQAHVVERIILKADSKARVLAMVKSDADGALFVGTEEGVYKVPLQHCQDYATGEACMKDPYCKWTNHSGCAYTRGDGSQDPGEGYIPEGFVILWRPPSKVRTPAGMLRKVLVVAEGKAGRGLRVDSEPATASCSPEPDCPASPRLLVHTFAVPARDREVLLAILNVSFPESGTCSCSVTLENNDGFSQTVQFDLITDTSQLIDTRSHPCRECLEEVWKYDNELQDYKQNLEEWIVKKESLCQDLANNSCPAK